MVLWICNFNLQVVLILCILKGTLFQSCSPWTILNNSSQIPREKAVVKVSIPQAIKEHNIVATLNQGTTPCQTQCRPFACMASQLPLALLLWGILAISPVQILSLRESPVRVVTGLSASKSYAGMLETSISLPLPPKKIIDKAISESIGITEWTRLTW